MAVIASMANRKRVPQKGGTDKKRSCDQQDEYFNEPRPLLDQYIAFDAVFPKAFSVVVECELVANIVRQQFLKEKKATDKHQLEMQKYRDANKQVSANAGM
ncbi:hypothetical protein Ciccas_006249 [Cichlidogyrus casuarinus]|uniref:Uncharacterized protein n=1 Tax=Cichlidogyrus casuarinus TaxID=1844966 RepID=A0ABD2Q6N9_9PLAT